jgi:hypothetical protein
VWFSLRSYSVVRTKLLKFKPNILDEAGPPCGSVRFSSRLPLAGSASSRSRDDPMSCSPPPTNPEKYRLTRFNPGDPPLQSQCALAIRPGRGRSRPGHCHTLIHSLNNCKQTTYVSIAAFRKASNLLARSNKLPRRLWFSPSHTNTVTLTESD